MATPHLTTMRQSLWDAINNWPDLINVFHRKWRFEDTGAMLLADFVPTVGELPSLAIAPTTAASEWATNQQQRIVYAQQIVWWTRGLSLLEGERIWQWLCRAIWQSSPGVGSPYVLAATDEAPLLTGPASVQLPGVAGKSAMVRWSMTVTLSKRWNPRTDAGALT